MRSLPLFMRFADDMKRIALSSSRFHEDPWRWYRLVRPELRHFEQQVEDVPKVDKDGYQVHVDVADFKPNELTVKVVDDSVIVEGKHEERKEQGGFISRQFVRRYLLPRGYDSSKALSTLSSDGVLTVKVPNPAKSNERSIPIHQTGPANLNVKNNPHREKSEEH